MALFIQQHWIAILVGLFIVMLVSSFLRSLFRIIIILAVLTFAILVFKLHYSPQKVIEATVSTISSTIQPVIQSELKDATCKKQPDGSYIIQTKSILIKGNTNNSDLYITFLNHSYHLKFDQLDASLQSQIKSLIN